MNLLIASDCFLPRKDGVASFLNAVIPTLSRKFRVSVIAPDFGKLKGYRGVKILRFPLSGFKIGDYPVPKPSYKIISREVRKADVVWTNTIGLVGALAIIAAGKEGKPLLSYVHSIEWELVAKSAGMRVVPRKVISALTKIPLKNLYSKCGTILVPYSGLGKELSLIGVRTRKKVVRIGIDASRFLPAKSIDAAKAAIGISRDKKVVGFCGRIGREKDIGTLLRAFDELRKKRKDAVLLVVGTGIKKIEDSLKCKEGVVFAGEKDDVVPFLQAMDVFVLPSLTETTSMVTLEAMSCGLPVITTPVGYLKEYIKGGFNGLLFRKKDWKGLSRAIERLLEDKKFSERLGRNARNMVMKRFAEERMVSGIVEEIQRASKLSS